MSTPHKRIWNVIKLIKSLILLDNILIFKRINEYNVENNEYLFRLGIYLFKTIVFMFKCVLTYYCKSKIR